MDSIVRLFLIINKLIEAPHTIRELQNIVWNEFSISPHNIYKDIKMLRKLGFNITKPKKDSLRIEALPFNFKIYEEDKELINDLFNSYTNNSIQLSNFLERLSNFLNFELDNIISYENILVYENKEIYSKIKKKILDAIPLKKKIRFKYRAVDKETKEYDVFPYLIEKDEKKVERVIVFNDYFENYSEYNLDRIKSVPEILDKEVFKGEFPNLFCYFKLYLPVSKSYHKLAGEIDESFDDEEGSRIIKTRYFTPFRLIQCYGVQSYPLFQLKIAEKKSSSKSPKKKIKL